MLMLLVATGGIVGNGDAGHTQIPHSGKRNNKRQRCQNSYSAPPSSFSNIQFSQILFNETHKRLSFWLVVCLFFGGVSVL